MSEIDRLGDWAHKRTVQMSRALTMADHSDTDYNIYCT